MLGAQTIPVRQGALVEVQATPAAPDATSGRLSLILGKDPGCTICSKDGSSKASSHHRSARVSRPCPERPPGERAVTVRALHGSHLSTSTAPRTSSPRSRSGRAISRRPSPPLQTAAPRTSVTSAQTPPSGEPRVTLDRIREVIANPNKTGFTRRSLATHILARRDPCASVRDLPLERRRANIFLRDPDLMHCTQGGHSTRRSLK
jgi:hypothetical protein